MLYQSSLSLQERAPVSAICDTHGAQLPVAVVPITVMSVGDSRSTNKVAKMVSLASSLTERPSFSGLFPGFVRTCLPRAIESPIVAIVGLCFMVSANASAAQNARMTNVAKLTVKLPTSTFRPINSTWMRPSSESSAAPHQQLSSMVRWWPRIMAVSSQPWLGLPTIFTPPFVLPARRERHSPENLGLRFSLKALIPSA